MTPHRDVLDTAEEIESAAVAYARAGVYVFPVHVPVTFGRKGTGSGAAVCSCGGKWRGVTRSAYTPCADQCKHGVRDLDRGMTGGIHGASNDPELTAARWEHWAPASIGCDTRRSQLVVIDVDNSVARQRLRKLVAEHGPLDAAVALTARGEHYWCSLPPGDYRSCRLGSLELKCTTAVVLPPSWHCTGARYSWLLRDPLVAGGFPPAPSWLVDLVRRPASTRAGAGDHDARRDHRDGARAGSRSGNGTSRYRGIGHGTGPALRRFRRLVKAIERADDGRHDLLNVAWFAAGSYAANGWLDHEWAEHQVLVPLTRQCGAKHTNNLSGFRSALRSGLADPEWGEELR